MIPNYLLNIGSKTFSPENGAELVSIKVQRSVGLPIDSCEVFLVGGKNYSFRRDDSVRVQLGYDDKLLPVFSGFVDNIEQGFSKVRLTGLGPTIALLRLRLNRVFLNQTAGKIVRSLAQEAGVNVGAASEGINLPMYVVDDAANAYEHVLRLAERCNFDVYTTEDAQLVFQEWNGGEQHTLEYAKDIINAKELDMSPLYVGAKIFGESPASFKGSETSHWLTKQEVGGEAGSGAVLSMHDPAIRDKKTAETVAKAKLNKLKYTLVVGVETVGKPEVKLGDTVILEGVSNSAFKGELEVREVEHFLSKVKGLTSRITCWRKT